jgi:hypothetical protein
MPSEPEIEGKPLVLGWLRFMRLRPIAPHYLYQAFGFENDSWLRLWEDKLANQS